MEYQHAVFEEFARKVQPAVRPFHVYSPDINPAVEAEFAHAVYRFGHSMLDDDVARTTTNPDGSKTDNSIPLLTAFLNPPEFFNNGQGGFYTPQQAAGAIVMGSSDQVGNELDEFVTETLRNNLLGLPLDLPTLNLTRAREAGVPPLNDVRRQIHAETNDAQLAPYTSWADFGQHLKHPESLINFVAAYGTHPTIRDSGPDGILGNADDVTTIAAKRAAARAIVDPLPTDTPPADAADFMFSNGPVWASDANGVTNTGLDKVDLWVGGLAEVTNLFGGLLGTHVQLRLPESAREAAGRRPALLPGPHPGPEPARPARGQLVRRARPAQHRRHQLAQGRRLRDGRLQVPAGQPRRHGGRLSPCTGSWSPTTRRRPTATRPCCSCACPTARSRTASATRSTRAASTASRSTTAPPASTASPAATTTTPSGVAAGNDRIEGNGGDDVALGGDGNDIITDLDGADTLKGGPGNDAMDAGPGNDLVIGADGQDFMNGGANDNEAFGGPGNDFIIAGQGADAVFGDGGDDWIEGGTGQDLLQGDHGAPFFDDPAQVAPGNDIFIGQPGENDYDAEGGDDLMAQNAAIDRNAGAGGFDWAFHQYDTAPADDDMEINNNLVGLPIQVVVNRDRWQETEADSGSSFDDVIKGTETAPNTVGGAGFTGCDVLDQAGVNRIAGLSAIVPQPLTESAATVIANSAAGFCPVTGPVFGAGDILLGGAGSDTITGRGADDIIDGDRELTVRISVRDNFGTEIGSTDLMEHPALTGNFGPGSLPGMTLQEAVFKGIVDPGNLVAVREIKTPGPNNDTDTAVFRNPLQHLHDHAQRERQHHGRQPGRHRRYRHALEHRAAAVLRHDHPGHRQPDQHAGHGHRDAQPDESHRRRRRDRLGLARGRRRRQRCHHQVQLAERDDARCVGKRHEQLRRRHVHPGERGSRTAPARGRHLPRQRGQRRDDHLGTDRPRGSTAHSAGRAGKPGDSARGTAHGARGHGSHRKRSDLRARHEPGASRLGRLLGLGQGACALRLLSAGHQVPRLEDDRART